MGGVLGIAVAKVILHRTQIGALIGQVVAAGVAEHVRPDATELCGLASDPHDIIDGLAGELAPRSDTNAKADCPRGWRGSA